MKKNSELTKLILKAVALAMGIAVLVLSILGETEADTSITMLAIGLVCLALSQFTKEK